MSETTDLAALLSPAAVRARLQVATWEEAVDRAGQLMVGAGLCTAQYARAMVDVVRDMGAYAVVAPGVAMPHARPEMGVLRPGVAVMTLRQPVEFGHATNDPVDLLVPFAAVDKDAHLQTLQCIVAMLQDVEALKAVRAASSDTELLQALRSTAARS